MRQPAAPRISGPPFAIEPQKLSLGTPCASSRQAGKYWRLKYQPYDMQKYIAQSAQRFPLRKSRPHGTRASAGSVVSAIPARINANSASLAAGCSSGRLRNQRAKAMHQPTPTAPNPKNAQRHDTSAQTTTAVQISGVNPPIKRAESQT